MLLMGTYIGILLVQNEKILKNEKNDIIHLKR